MTVSITIRGVPEKVRDELAERAALQGQSLQQYLRVTLERLTAKPSIETWLRQVRARKRAAQAKGLADYILKSRDADRR